MKEFIQFRFDGNNSYKFAARGEKFCYKTLWTYWQTCPYIQ